MRPQPDNYPEHLARAIKAAIEHGQEQGGVELREIAYPPREFAKRPTLPRSLYGEIFQRDRFQCRYCGGKTILTSLMELVSGLYPDIFPFHENWKGGLTHPAIITRSAMLDHVEPVSLGGSSDDPENLVTACNPCNSIKSDFTLEQLGWRRQDPPDDRWDGLASLYQELWNLAGRPKPHYHRDSLSAG